VSATAVVFWGVAAAFLAVPVIFPSAFFADDVYFYLQVARHVAAGDGSTFNGIVPTNGYHPLWLLVCALLALVTRGATWPLLHLAALVASALNLAALVVFRALSRRLGHVSWHLGGALLLLFSGGLFLGSELHLSLLTLVVLLYALADDREPSPARDWTVHGAASLALLARLDNVFTVGCLITWWLARELRARRLDLRRVLIAACPYALVVVPYLVYNQLCFGHLVPISGAIKSAQRHGTPLAQAGHAAQLAIFVNALVVGVTALKRPAGARALLLPLALGFLVQSTWVLTRMTATWAWYWGPGFVTVGLAANELVAASGARWASDRAAAIAAAVATLLLLAYGGRTMPPRVRALDWPPVVAAGMKSAGLQTARLFALDAPGQLAFLSGAPVLAADGLTNDFGYQEDIVREGIIPYLRRRGVDYVFGSRLGPYRPGDELPWSDPRSPGEGVVFSFGERGGAKLAVAGEVYAMLSGERAGRIVLDEKNLVRRFPGLPGVTPAIFRLGGGE